MIVGALLARNEAAPDRYLRIALANAASLCDALLVVDDGSDDATAAVCEEYGATVLKAATGGFWSEGETPARAALWDAACERAGPNGWVYIFDADHELLGLTRADMRALCRSEHVNAWAFPLYDCWDDPQRFRCDGYWQGFRYPRPWLVKAQPHADYLPMWPNTKIHVGHAPANYPYCIGLAPNGALIRHWGYVQESHRLRKAERYLSLPHLTEFERAHAQSILEPAVTAPLPPGTPRILIGSVIRKPREVVDALARTLKWQRLKQPVVADFCFVLNFPAAEAATAKEVADAIKAQIPEALLAQADAAAGDYGDGAQTRMWTPNAWHRVGALKNELLKRAAEGGYDYAWLVDADVLCDPYTLQSMLEQEAPIVSAVYWTQWQRPSGLEAAQVHAGPQVWLSGSYGMDGKYMTAPEFRQALVNRERVEVGGLGACTLISKAAIQRGINFTRLEDFDTQGPMGDGEDRHFCERARRAHLPLIADAWPDIYHAYHAADYGEIPTVMERLGRAHPTKVSFGDLVSFTVLPLEPIQQPQGPAFVSKQWIRGRIGRLKLLPEIEDALLNLTPGEAKVLKVHFPAHWPAQEVAGQNRILQLHLLDVKPFGFAPVIERELLVNPSGAYIDSTQHTTTQLEEILDGQVEQVAAPAGADSSPE